MFQDMSPQMKARMEWLERLDSEDRRDGTPRIERLRQIPPVTGRLLAILAASAPGGDIIEIGTSGGYSTLWLSLACSKTGRRVTTFEILDDKVKIARETFRIAGVTDLVSLVHGDARKLLAEFNGIGFCFLDAEKEYYEDLYELVVPRLIPGGILVADNVISHKEELQPFIDRANRDDRVDCVIVPIGKGELLCRKIRE